MPTISTDFILVPGPGVLGWQPYTATTANQFMQLRTFGATTGMRISTTRETLDFDEGTPSTAVVTDVIRESGEAEITVAEKAVDDLINELGYGTVTAVNATTAEEDDFHLFLVAYGWQVIPQVRYTMMNTVAVVLASATGTTYSGTTDYETGNVEGRLAIRRRSGSTIADRAEVIATVNYDTPSSRHITLGGSNSLSFVHLCHVKEMRPGVSPGRCEITYMYKAGTSGEVVEEFPKDSHAERSVKFKLLADTTRSAGDRLWKKVQENAA